MFLHMLYRTPQVLPKSAVSRNSRIVEKFLAGDLKSARSFRTAKTAIGRLSN